MDILHAMAAALIEHETIDKHQIEELMSRRFPANRSTVSAGDAPPNGASPVPTLEPALREVAHLG